MKWYFWVLVGFGGSVLSFLDEGLSPIHWVECLYWMLAGFAAGWGERGVQPSPLPDPSRSDAAA